MIQDVSPAQLHDWLARGTARLVDVREPDEFARERIEGATPAPLSRFTPSDWTDSSGPRLVLCCRSGLRSGDAAGRVLAAGRAEVFHLKGGLRAWAAAGLDVQRDHRTPVSIMRQVQIVAGSLVVAGTLMGVMLSPWFLLLSGLAGSGLLLAGLTDTCAMASLLRHMPWNRRISTAREESA